MAAPPLPGNGLYIVTGANAGIGKEITAGLMQRGHHVIMACRDAKRCAVAKKELDARRAGGSSRGSCECAILDLAQPESIRSFAQQFCKRKERLSLLVNNAGVMGLPVDPDGSDPHLRINHLGPFLLTSLLVPTMQSGSRIVNVASRAHFQGSLEVKDGSITGSPGNWYSAYARSKLCNVLHTAELQRRLRPAGIQAFSVSPGRVYTGMTANLVPSLKWLIEPLVRLSFQSPAQGASTVLMAATDTVNSDTLYFHAMKETEPSAASRDPELAKRLWDASMRLTESPPL